MLGVVVREVERRSALRCRQHGAGETRRPARAGARRGTTSARGADAGRSASREQAVPRATSSTSGSRSGSGSPSATNGTRSRTTASAVRGAAPERSPRGARRPARRDEELDRDDPPARARTCSASRRAASGAIVIRSSMPSAWVVETSSSDTGCASSRASAASAWTAMPSSLSALSARPRPLAEPFREAGQRRLQELHRALGRARQHRREREPREVERASRARRASKFPTETTAASVDDDERVRLGGVELDARPARRRSPSASRAAPCSCGSVRKLSGSCSERAGTRSPRAASAAARASARGPATVGPRRSPGGGATRDSRRAPRGRAPPATSSASSRMRASWTRKRGVARSRTRSGSGARSPRPAPEHRRRAARPRGRPVARDRSARSSRATAPAAGRPRSAPRRRAPRARAGPRSSPARARSPAAAPSPARRRAGRAGPWAIRCWRTRSASCPASVDRGTTCGRRRPSSRRSASTSGDERVARRRPAPRPSARSRRIERHVPAAPRDADDLVERQAATVRHDSCRSWAASSPTHDGATPTRLLRSFAGATHRDLGRQSLVDVIALSARGAQPSERRHDERAGGDEDDRPAGRQVGVVRRSSARRAPTRARSPSRGRASSAGSRRSAARRSPGSTISAAISRIPTMRIEIATVSAASTATVDVHQPDPDAGDAAALLVEHRADEPAIEDRDRGERAEPEDEHDPEIAPRDGQDRAEEELEEVDVERGRPSRRARRRARCPCRRRARAPGRRPCRRAREATRSRAHRARPKASAVSTGETPSR